MKIDIIDLTDPKYSGLKPKQLMAVREAQGKKNEILAKAKKTADELFYLLMDHHFERSSTYDNYVAQINAEAENDVENLRDDLILRLAYETPGLDGNEYGPYSYPENPDYSLSEAERFRVVCDYYMEIKEPKMRLQIFALDTLAQTYLGQYYQTLYDLLASYCP